jgi:hypothetical protein
MSDDTADRPDEPGVPRETIDASILRGAESEFSESGDVGKRVLYRDTIKALGAEYARRLRADQTAAHLAEINRALERRVNDLEFMVAVRDKEIQTLDADRKRIAKRADDESARLADIKRIIEAPPKILVHSPSMEQVARETREAAPHPDDGHDRRGVREIADDLECRLRDAEKH